MYCAPAAIRVVIAASTAIAGVTLPTPATAGDPAHLCQTGSPRLRPVTSVGVPAIDRFVAKEHFEIGAEDVAIKTVSDIFVWYFDIVEEQVPAAELKVYRLTESSLDTSIIADLHDQHETRLSQLWALLTRQGHGEAGPLLTDGQSNLFYVRDGQGMLWTLSVTWTGGWEIDIGSIGAAYPWRAGRQVIAR